MKLAHQVKERLPREKIFCTKSQNLLGRCCRLHCIIKDGHFLPKKGFSLGNVAEGILRVGAVAGGTGSQQIGRSDLWVWLLNVNFMITLVLWSNLLVFLETCSQSLARGVLHFLFSNFALKTAFYPKVWFLHLEIDCAVARVERLWVLERREGLFGEERDLVNVDLTLERFHKMRSCTD